jgi:hypothetical protein
MIIMKKKFQWLSALALMVMSALAFVACGSDDDEDNGGGGGSSDNSKIVGTWVIRSVSPEDGPRVNGEMTFNSNGTFSQGRDQGTYTYDSKTGKFTAKMNQMTMDGSFTVNGDVCSGSVRVTENGRTQIYTMSMEKKGSGGEEGGEEGGDEPSADVEDTRIVGSWLVTLDDDTPSSVGKTVTFKANGTWSNGSASGTYTTHTETNEGREDRIRFVLKDNNGNSINEGKLVLVSEGNVLTGYYWRYGNSGQKLRLNMKKANYTYPSGGIKGRWLMKSSTVSGPPVGEVMVFGNNNEFYIEGDAHFNTYTYSGNTLTINLSEDGPMSGSLSISGKIATFIMDMNGQSATIKLEKQ